MSGTRHFPSWLSGYLAYTAGREAPERLRLWSALTLVSAATERRVWLPQRGHKVYPNLYTVLVAPPGIGKTSAAAPAVAIGRAAGLIVAPDMITPQRLYQRMDQNEGDMRRVLAGLEVTTPVLLFASEAAQFFNTFEIQKILPVLTDMWDCPATSSYETKTSGTCYMENIYFTMLVGCTPTWIASNLPASAFEDGFAARCFFILAREKVDLELTQDENDGAMLDPEVAALLAADLQRIMQLRGRMTFTEEAFTRLRDWHREGMPPIPSDAKLHAYNTRRLHQFTKLCMCVSLAKRDSMMIEVEDYEEAKANLLDAEAELSRSSWLLGSSRGATIMLQVWRAVNAEFTSRNAPVSEAFIRSLLARELPPYEVERTMKLMEETCMLQRRTVIGSNWIYYTPHPAFRPGEGLSDPLALPVAAPLIPAGRPPTTE